MNLKEMICPGKFPGRTISRQPSTANHQLSTACKGNDVVIPLLSPVLTGMK